VTLMNQAAGEERRAAIHQRHVQRLCKRQVVPQPRWGVWDTPASCPFVLRPRVARPDFGRDFESKNGKRNFENDATPFEPLDVPPLAARSSWLPFDPAA